MTDDTDGNRQSNRPTTGTNTQAADSAQSWTREQWESLKSNPADSDLGYERTEWDQFETLDGTDQLIFLPNNESYLKDAEFIVAGERLILDLEDQC